MTKRNGDANIVLPSEYWTRAAIQAIKMNNNGKFDASLIKFSTKISDQAKYVALSKLGLLDEIENRTSSGGNFGGEGEGNDGSSITNFINLAKLTSKKKFQRSPPPTESILCTDAYGKAVFFNGPSRDANEMLRNGLASGFEILPSEAETVFGDLDEIRQHYISPYTSQFSFVSSNSSSSNSSSSNSASSSSFSLLSSRPSSSSGKSL